ncbi:MAG: alpha/beta fold hydrolase, partial [Polyangiaceae bacterium]|nr:alpha/beta fold hydrolase [Polyangiaceae bacterium]
MKALGLLLFALAFSGCQDGPRGAPDDGARGRAVARADGRTAPEAESSEAKAPPPPDGIELVPEFETASTSPYSFTDEDIEAWRELVPEIREVSITSSTDGSEQRALFYDPGGDAPRPLVVSLHSWSAGYLQNIDIPFAVFARRNGWVFVHPDHRGRNDRPQATNSEHALEDVIDAMEYARSEANVDPSRIYLIGYSGGAMAALVLAARHPDLWAGVVAWVPVFDLGDWHQRARGRHPRYVREIEASCGGAPHVSPTAKRECRARSPSAHLESAPARFGVYIAAGIEDPLVPPDHGMLAFNRLARPEDRFDGEEIAFVRRHGALPP